jgi:hypothetical protein
MARYARGVQLEHFKKMLYKKISKNLYSEDLIELGDWNSAKFNWAKLLHSVINEDPFYTIRQKDLKKVIFSFDNIIFRQEDQLMGFHQIGELSFLGLSAGGSWEWPVHFILYVNEKNQIRGYIPENGNLYNKKTASAYGNHETLDNRMAKELYDVDDYRDLGRENEDFDAMIKDITTLVTVRENIEQPIEDNNDNTR